MMKGFGAPLLVAAIWTGGVTANACPVSTRTIEAAARVSIPASLMSKSEMAVVAASRDSDDDRDSSGIVGLWEVTVKSGGQVIDQAIETFNADGSEILIDVAPPAQGNVCLGTWKSVNGTIRLKHPAWTFDKDGNLTGRIVILSTIRLVPRNNTFAGTFDLQIMDNSGNLLATVQGTLEGKRITVN
jgi:hypothetical protein